MKRLLPCLLIACGDSPTVYFDRDTSTPDTYWNFPFPSDVRLDATGAPDLTAFPNPRMTPLMTSLLTGVPARRGWPTMPTAYFRFTEPPPVTTPDVVLSGGPLYLIDIDPASPERGTKFPIIAKTLVKDGYTTTNV